MAFLSLCDTLFGSVGCCEEAHGETGKRVSEEAELELQALEVAISEATGKALDAQSQALEFSRQKEQFCNHSEEALVKKKDIQMQLEVSCMGCFCC